ncbi:MAG: NAD-binding protein [Phycisphaerales bacterium]|nr:NAD-binding protein [Phycisphaerales bacterium]
MKSIAAQILILTRQRSSRRNLKALAKFLAVLIGMILTYTVIFHFIMDYEDQDHTLISGLYWTLVTMSTLGFGDITFESDLGRVFTIIVILSGTLFLLVLLPFTFIQFFYAPWMESQAQASVPQNLPESEHDHILLTQLDPVTEALIKKLEQFGHSYALIVEELDQTRRLHDQNYRVMHGDLDDPETYEAARLGRAAMLVSTLSDAEDTTVCITARGVSDTTPIVTTVEDPISKQIHEMAGASDVIRLPEIMGQALARCSSGGDAITHTVASFGTLHLAEANAAKTPLVGKTLRENRLGDLGVSVAGLWERGDFKPAGPDSVVGPNTVLMVVGSEEQLLNYDEHFAIYAVTGEPVILIGSGRIGKATAEALEERGVKYRVIEQDPRRVIDPVNTIVGNAADPEILKEAGIATTPTVIITTNDDDTNLYLTLLCRQSNPDVEIIARCTLDKHVKALHKAGADFVQSYASIGASSIFNLLQKSRVVTVTQGLDVFRVNVPEEVVGKRIMECGIREKTGCTIIGYHDSETLQPNPRPETVLEKGREMLMIGDWESRNRFFKAYNAS